MTQFPEMLETLEAQPPFSGELSCSFSAGTWLSLTLGGTAGTGMFPTISSE